MQEVFKVVSRLWGDERLISSSLHPLLATTYRNKSGRLLTVESSMALEKSKQAFEFMDTCPQELRGTRNLELWTATVEIAKPCESVIVIENNGTVRGINTFIETSSRVADVQNLKRALQVFGFGEGGHGCDVDRCIEIWGARFRGVKFAKRSPLRGTLSCRNLKLKERVGEASEMAKAVHRLHTLLSDPQPGLMSWNGGVNSTLEDVIAELKDHPSWPSLDVLIELKEAIEAAEKGRR